MTTLSPALEYLRTPEAVRERSRNVFEAGLAGELSHLSIRLDRLPQAAREVAAATRREYPDGAVPLHGRLRHFGAGGVDRIALLEEKLGRFSGEEAARVLIDLVVTSVLLDAGAGPDWRFHEEDTGLTFTRSEGLAVASLHMFLSGAFAHLDSIEASDVAKRFQVRDGNHLVGLEGRAQLLRSLARAMEEQPEIFGSPPRAGNLFDFWKEGAERGGVPAREILRTLLVGLAAIWPSRLELGGVSLGDVGRHPRAGGEGESAGVVPFHKLSQWLAYSLVEPLARGGIEVVDIDALTGLAEYRNGGLFVDSGVLVPKHRDVTEAWHEPGAEVVVEWRALTVSLLDLMAEPVREELGMNRESLPLAKVLEGGTWRAGRNLAERLRPGGPPPIRVRSDGTLF